jgi:hypothetical protein
MVLGASGQRTVAKMKKAKNNATSTKNQGQHPTDSQSV